VICNRGDGTRCFVSLRPELEHAFPGLLKSILAFTNQDDDQARLCDAAELHESAS
jgi:hypothetical protein